METLIHVCVSLWHLAHACFSMFKWKITLLSIRYICSFLFIFLSCSVCRVSLLLCLFLKWLRYIESLPCSAVVTFSTCRLSGDTLPPHGPGAYVVWCRTDAALRSISSCPHPHASLCLLPQPPNALAQGAQCGKPGSLMSSFSLTSLPFKTDFQF